MQTLCQPNKCEIMTESLIFFQFQTIIFSHSMSLNNILNYNHIGTLHQSA